MKVYFYTNWNNFDQMIDSEFFAFFENDPGPYDDPNDLDLIQRSLDTDVRCFIFKIELGLNE
jgi:hypothetical protein